MTHLKGGGILDSDELDKNKEMTDSRWRELWEWSTMFILPDVRDCQLALREALTAIVIERAMRRKAQWAKVHAASVPATQCLLCGIMNEMNESHKWSDSDWIAAEWAALGVEPC